MNRSWVRMSLWSVGVIAMLLGGAMEAIRWLDTFSGEICVGTSGAERVAVREPEPDRVPFSMGRTKVLRDAPIETIPFQTPEVSTANLDESRKYDALELPFSIRLKRAVALGNEESHDELHINAPDGEKMVEIVPNKTVDIDGITYQVDAIKPWSGLLRESGGTPMAMIALRKGEEAWTEGIFLMADAWRHVEPSIGLRFQWPGSEEAANVAADAGLPGIDSARWGATDGKTMNWFESFSPNEGFEFTGGTTIHLIREDEVHANPAGTGPAIEVEWSEAGQTRRQWVPANTADDSVRVRFEYPARLDTVILLYAISERKLLATMYDHGKPLGRQIVSEGASWRPDGAPFELRVDQALERAVAVPATETKLAEAILKAPSGVLRVREGEAVRQGDSLVQFSRRTRMPDVKYELAVIGKDPKRERPIAIGPDDTVRYDNCRLSLAPPCTEPLHAAVLRVEYVPSQAWSRLLLAAALALMIWLAIHPRKSERTMEVNSVRMS